MSVRPGEGEPDSIWVTVEFPLSPPALREFLADTERLFRLHPHLEISAWEAQAGGGFLLTAKNEASSSGMRTSVQRRDEQPAAGFTLAYDAGLKRDTVFRLAPFASCTQLTVTEHYQPLSGPNDARRTEVDTTLTSWIVTLRQHLAARQQWGRLPGWRWWNERFLLRIAPRQRRIVRLLVWISAAEFLVFLVAVLVLRAAS